MNKIDEAFQEWMETPTVKEYVALMGVTGANTELLESALFLAFVRGSSYGVDLLLKSREVLA